MAVDPLGFGRITHKFTTSDGAWDSGHDVFLTGTPLQADLDQWCADASTAWFDNILGMLSSSCTYVGASLRYSDGTTEMEGTSTVLDNGGASGSGTPLSIAVVLSMKISSFYRGGHPRMYLAGVPESAIGSDKTFGSTFVGDMETGWAAYLDTVAGLTETNITSTAVGVIHRVSGGAPLVPPTFEPFTGSKVQRRICSQRRRLGALL